MTIPEPTPDQQRQLLKAIPGDAGVALRLVSAFLDGDGDGAQGIVAEIAAGKRVLNVLSTLTVMCCRLAHALVTQAGGDAATWAHGAAMAVMDEVDVVVERIRGDE
jgi:hypothetical protein